MSRLTVGSIEGLTENSNVISVPTGHSLNVVDGIQVDGEYMTPYAGRRNLLYNGAMQVAQRGTSVAGITGSGYHTADRWNVALTSLGTWTQSVEADAPTGSGFSKSTKLLCTTANASPGTSNAFRFDQRLEGQDLQSIKKGTSSAERLTLSFWVKSNVTGTYVVWLYDADNARSVAASYSVSASGSWEKKTITFPADTSGAFDDNNGSSLWVSFVLAAGTDWTSGTLATTWEADTTANRAVGQTNLAAATSNYWQITGVQLELGDKATPFEHRSYGEELSLCRRYFLIVGEKGADFKLGRNNSGTYRMIGATFSPMRAVPTATVYFDRDNGSEIAAGATQKSISSAFYDAGGSGSYTDVHAVYADAEL